MKRSRSPKVNWWKHSRRQPTVELRSSTPTTAWSPQWRVEPRPGSYSSASRKTATFGATDVVVDDQARASFTLNCSQGSARIRLAVHGEHHVSNALAAAAVALENGLAVADIARVLEGTKAASARRMEVTERADGVTVVNDSYNANPDSMRAALKALVSMARSDRHFGRRSWAVLGEMGELGPESVVEHDAIGRLAVRLDVSKLIVVGTGRTSRAMHQGAVMEGSWG